MKGLYEFYWDCGRNGELEGLFIATQEEVDAIIGRTMWLGEVLGKHSEIYGEIEEKDITLKSQEQAGIAWLERIFGGSTISGINPVEELKEQEGGEEDVSI